jgi:hypothetical protein
MPDSGRLSGGVLGSFRPATRRWVVALTFGGALVRLGLALLVGLSVDESYAVVMSRRLALSYFDHPPLLFWIPGLAARLTGSESPLVVRLPFIVLFMGTTWLVFRLTAFLFDEAAGLWAAVALNLVLFFTLSAASWVLPDGPLLFFTVAAALCLARAIWGSPPAMRSLPSESFGWWMGFGLCAGLALLSKYHGAFLLAGAALFLATSSGHRAWLRHPEPYLAVLLAVFVFLPVVVWNADHDWASFRFQGARAVPLEPENDSPFWGSIAGQGAWILPWLWVPLLVVLASALRRGPGDSRRWFLLCLSIGPIVVFTAFTAFGRRGLPHWQAPGYFMLLPLLGASIASRLEGGERGVRRWLWGSGAGLAVVLVVIVSQTRTGWIGRVAPELLEKGDPTDDLLQWTPVVDRLREWGYPRPGLAVAGATWADAAKLAYALGPTVRVTSVGGDPRGFEFVESQSSLVGRDVLLVARRRAGYMEPMIAYAPYFRGMRGLDTIPILRRGREEIAVSVYVGRGLVRPVPPTTRAR